MSRAHGANLWCNVTNTLSAEGVGTICGGGSLPFMTVEQAVDHYAATLYRVRQWRPVVTASYSGTASWIEHYGPVGSTNPTEPWYVLETTWSWTFSGLGGTYEDFYPEVVEYENAPEWDAVRISSLPLGETTFATGENPEPFVTGNPTLPAVRIGNVGAVLTGSGPLSLPSCTATVRSRVTSFGNISTNPSNCLDSEGIPVTLNSRNYIEFYDVTLTDNFSAYCEARLLPMNRLEYKSNPAKVIITGAGGEFQVSGIQPDFFFPNHPVPLIAPDTNCQSLDNVDIGLTVGQIDFATGQQINSVAPASPYIRVTIPGWGSLPAANSYAFSLVPTTAYPVGTVSSGAPGEDGYYTYTVSYSSSVTVDWTPVGCQAYDVNSTTYPLGTTAANAIWDNNGNALLLPYDILFSDIVTDGTTTTFTCINPHELIASNVVRIVGGVNAGLAGLLDFNYTVVTVTSDTVFTITLNGNGTYLPAEWVVGNRVL